MNKLTQDRLKELFLYEPETGKFTRKSTPNRKVGSVTSHGRLNIFIDYQQYYAHRLAWLYVYGSWPVADVDHIDGNPLNNAIENLRDVSRSVNMQNIKRARKDSHSGLVGVLKDKRKDRYMAYICVDGGRKYLGTFDTAEQANAAYLSVKRLVHPGCTI